MLETLKRGWWLLVLSGICAIAFGVLTFVNPKITVKTLVFLFGAYALANGILTLMVAIRAPKGTPGTGTLWVLGLLSLAAGILTFLYPGLTALTLLLVIAWWAITTGVFEIAAAIRLRKQLTNEWLLILSGALSVVFGAFLIIKPGAGALSVVWLIGAYAIAFGVMILAFALKVKGFAPSMQSARRMA